MLDVMVQGGPKVSLHTLGLIPTSCFTLEGCCFADGILYLLVRGIISIEHSVTELLRPTYVN